ncbi:RagB/SusD family nutrient uptake outer membrane protein [Flavicella sediminum]|uniref:RagB/SusD family nutrient uptake outer membrane protein n=1 Tax=Flavicella sediminum TaxID=2585141 RepID=UPI00111F743F|nr:RagB/SusD family nutrient uptake outer membrane protein [Flavicella sediminum]
MKNLIKYILVVLVFTGMIACDKLEPIDENRLDFDYVSKTPQAAEGILLQGYSGLISQYSFSEAATDDAVNNILNNGYKRMALGELNAQYNPASRWNSFERVFFVNQFLEIINAGEIVWNRDEVINELFYKRLKGEALALRALHHFYVLQAHAGEDASGQLLGIPYFTEFIGADGNFNIPRLSFTASIEAIMSDFNDALTLLPTDYSDDAGAVDAWYSDVDFGKYKVANGAQYNLRVSGRIVKALKARVALFAASPSFLNGQSGYYDVAADMASEVLNTVGGIAGMDPQGVEFYATDDNLTSGEMLWRSSVGGNSSTYEERIFPPSVNGKGEINPTHNFVMAFPMINGLPATAGNGYDAQNPYANRDPRLDKYVVVNGSSYAGGTINTGVGGKIDRIDSIQQFSTTTGYYLKKLLRPDVRINNDGTTNAKRHVNVYFRYTELFLILAEAANEINGPDHSINGMSARDILGAIRQRAGITQPDAYLASMTTKEQMRELIRNERRIELSFEGHRFWDLRRWGMALNEAASGYFHDGSAYVELPSVEIRNYPAHAIYLPIPNAETLKFNELKQNNNW